MSSPTSHIHLQIPTIYVLFILHYFTAHDIFTCMYLLCCYYSARLLSIYPVGWLARMCKVYVVSHGSLPEVELYQVYKCDCEYAVPSILSEIQPCIISEVFSFRLPHSTAVQLWTVWHSTERPIYIVSLTQILSSISNLPFAGQVYLFFV